MLQWQKERKNTAWQLLIVYYHNFPCKSSPSLLIETITYRFVLHTYWKVWNVWSNKRNGLGNFFPAAHWSFKSEGTCFVEEAVKLQTTYIFIFMMPVFFKKFFILFFTTKIQLFCLDADRKDGLQNCLTCSGRLHLLFPHSSNMRAFWLWFREIFFFFFSWLNSAQFISCEPPTPIHRHIHMSTHSKPKTGWSSGVLFHTHQIYYSIINTVRRS